ncbi:MAG: TlpA family protein disulfide reductase [Bacteroidales bacterium]|nr:TlpA family protein disulfide reductase [Bacteroidales bacterium]
MKHTAIIVALTLVAQLATAQKATLQGLLEGCPEGTALVLNTTSGSNLVPADTLRLDSRGRYKATLNPKEPTFYVITLTVPSSPMAHLFVLPGERITFDLKYMPEIHHLQVTSTKGSANAEVYRQFNNMISQATLDRSLMPTLPDRIEELLIRNRNVLMSAFLVTVFDQNFDSFAPTYKQIYDSLAPNYANNEFVAHIADKLRGQIIPGMEAPDIELTDAYGVTRRLSDLRGHLVLLDFWASWCRPCRAESPNVVRLYERYHKEGLEIFSVSLDNNREAWLKAIADDHLSWPDHVSELRGWTSSAARAYGVNSIPATFLIAPDGTVAARNLRGAELEQTLDDIFSNAPKDQK